MKAATGQIEGNVHTTAAIVIPSHAAPTARRPLAKNFPNQHQHPCVATFSLSGLCGSLRAETLIPRRESIARQQACSRRQSVDIDPTYELSAYVCWMCSHHLAARAFSVNVKKKRTKSRSQSNNASAKLGRRNGILFTHACQKAKIQGGRGVARQTTTEAPRCRYLVVIDTASLTEG